MEVVFLPRVRACSVLKGEFFHDKQGYPPTNLTEELIGLKDKGCCPNRRSTFRLVSDPVAVAHEEVLPISVFDGQRASAECCRLMLEDATRRKTMINKTQAIDVQSSINIKAANERTLVPSRSTTREKE